VATEQQSTTASPARTGRNRLLVLLAVVAVLGAAVALHGVLGANSASGGQATATCRDPRIDVTEKSTGGTLSGYGEVDLTSVRLRRTSDRLEATWTVRDGSKVEPSGELLSVVLTYQGKVRWLISASSQAFGSRHPFRAQSTAGGGAVPVDGSFTSTGATISVPLDLLHLPSRFQWRGETFFFDLSNVLSLADGTYTNAIDACPDIGESRGFPDSHR
jgi:hypothetical protein